MRDLRLRGAVRGRPKRTTITDDTAERPRDLVDRQFAENGVVNSVGSRGDSYDNALDESINGIYKTELVRRKGPWRGLDDLELATLEWVDWFNRRRLFYELGRIPPAEFKEQRYRQQLSGRGADTHTNTPA